MDTALAAAEIDGRVGENGLAALVIVLSGTGSVFHGKNAQGQHVRVGGWGHVVGDKGSAYEIGLRALKAVLFYYDRDGKVPPLGRRLLRALLLNELQEIPERAFNAGKAEIAAGADVSSAATGRQNRDILEGAAHTHCEDAIICASRLAPHGRRVKFVLTGSVLLNQPASPAAWQFICEQWRNSEVVPAET